MPHLISNSHQPIEESPRQDEARKATQKPTCPELHPTLDESFRIENRASFGERIRRHFDGIDEDSRYHGEDEVEEEAAVGLEAEDAGCDAEEGGCEAVEVGESLRIVSAPTEKMYLEPRWSVIYLGIVYNGLGHNGVDLGFAFGRHCRVAVRDRWYSLESVRVVDELAGWVCDSLYFVICNSLCAGLDRLHGS